MYRIKKQLLCLLVLSALLLSSLRVYAESELIAEDRIETDSTQYKTEEAAFSELVITEKSSADVCFPVVRTVLYEGKSAHVTEVLVKKDDTVSEGDPLITVQIDVDEIALREKELRLQRETEGRDNALAEYDRSIRELQEALGEASDAYELRKASLLLEKKQLERERYLYEEQLTLNALEEEIRELQEQLEPLTVYAPVSGTVTDAANYTENAAISGGSFLVSITEPASVLAKVSSAALPYGAGVSLSSSWKDETLALRGEVIFTSRSLPASSEAFTLIRMELSEVLRSDENPSGRELSEVTALLEKNLSVSGTRLTLPNVLTLSSDACKKDGSLYYVTLLDQDRCLRKRYISVGLSGDDRSWILTGVREGDSVVLNK